MDTKDDLRAKKWNHINTDLKSALDTWTELTEQLAHKLSPEEEQLREIKSILGALKDKLNEFNEEPKTGSRAKSPGKSTEKSSENSPENESKA